MRSASSKPPRSMRNASGPAAERTERSNPAENRPARPASTTAFTPSASARSSALPIASSIVGESAFAFPSSRRIVAMLPSRS